MRNQKQVVTAQYDPVAGAYLTSKAHAQGQDLQDLAGFAQDHPDARILDLGCGAGHASYAVAPFARQVTAFDLSERMLEVVRQSAADRQFTNIACQQGVVEALPFAADSFDCLITRFSAHHWVCIQVAVAEMMRVHNCSMFYKRL